MAGDSHGEAALDAGGCASGQPRNRITAVALKWREQQTSSPNVDCHQTRRLMCERRLTIEGRAWSMYFARLKLRRGSDLGFKARKPINPARMWNDYNAAVYENSLLHGIASTNEHDDNVYILMFRFS